MLQIFVKHLIECKKFRFAVDNSEHYHTEAFLKLCVLVKLIEHNLRIYISFKLDYYAYTLSVRLVADI